MTILNEKKIRENETNSTFLAGSLSTASELGARQIKYEQTAPVCVKAGWRRIGWLCFCYALVGAAIAFLTPERILDENQGLRALCTSVAESVAPAIPKYAHISTIPQVTTVYLTIMFLLLPITVMAAIASMPLVDYANFDWNQTKSANAGTRPS